VLDRIEREPGFAFTLDGQLATVDDYLELRPGAEERLLRLIEEGRLTIGPWQTLLDEFLVSGETIVRNLETGWRRAEELGPPMPVGYLPDAFGHIAQMPQILRGAGIEHAVVWRGVPAAVDAHTFRWEAPDGSAVRAEYLAGGYGNAAYLFDAPERLLESLDAFAEAMKPFFGEDDLLALYGTDHMAPAPDLVERVAELNAAQQRYEVRVTTLARYAAGAGPAPERPAWRGELRSAARANMLMGVTSARIDLKAAAARAERGLERYAEPLQALWGGAWPEEALRVAWRRVLDNSAHDSICGCSADAVSAQVLVRYAEAEQVATELTRRAVEAVAAAVLRGSVAVLNPSPFERRGLVELELPVPDEWLDVSFELPDGSRVGAQETSRAPVVLQEVDVDGAELATHLRRRLHGRELFGRLLNGFAVDGGVLTLDVDREPDPPALDVVALLEELDELSAESAGERWLLRIRARPRRTLAAVVPAPPLGFTSARPVEGPAAVAHAVSVGERMLANGLLEVEVAGDGTLTLASAGLRLAGVGRLVDGGDFGDSYNYAPPRRDALVDEPTSVSVEVVERGPVRGRLRLVRTYPWPLAVAPDGSVRSEQTAAVAVTTDVELRAGEPFARLRVSLDNRCRDHRLRFHVPLAAPAERAAAEGQFAVVERPPVPEAGHGEVPLPTYPARGFVDAGGVAVLLDHALEYELLDGSELALTLLRSIGLISRSDHPYREDPAGPEIPIPDAQCLGVWSVGFGLYPHAGSWVEAGVTGEAERYAHELPALPGCGGGVGPVLREGLRVEGAVLSSLRRRGDELELRLVNESPEAAKARVSGDLLEAREADLLGHPGEPLALEGGVLALELPAWRIRTVRLRRAP
jgi:mannosylglycerate hydrolase